MKDKFDKVIKAIATTKKHIRDLGKYKESFSGELDCPICKKGKVRFRHAGGYNQHTHGMCTTKNCANWME